MDAVTHAVRVEQDPDGSKRVLIDDQDVSEQVTDARVDVGSGNLLPTVTLTLMPRRGAGVDLAKANVLVELADPRAAVLDWLVGIDPAEIEQAALGGGMSGSIGASVLRFLGDRAANG